jgi:hypothetical protein
MQIWRAIRVSKPSNGDNAFTRGRTLRASRGRFMHGRQAPFVGYFDRLSGVYAMNHNKHSEQDGSSS